MYRSCSVALFVAFLLTAPAKAEVAPPSSGAVTCISSVLLEPGLLLYDAVETLEREYPEAVFRTDPFVCADSSKVPSERLQEIAALMQRLPSRLVERAARAYVETAGLPLGRLEQRGTTSDAGVASEHAATASGPLGLSPKLGRDIVMINVIGVASFGIIYALPESVSNWDRSQVGWKRFSEAYTKPPVWDEDAWYINYLIHPTIGMHTYLLQRNHGVSWLRSFLFSTAASVGWEYLHESWGERPSAQDLLFTSTIGSVMGELNYQLTQWMRKDGFNTAEKIIVTILNPVYVIDFGYK